MSFQKASGTISLLALSVACGTTPSPSGPSPTPPPLTLSVTGQVVDTAHRNLSMARLEVIDGPLAGTTAFTGADGRFLMPGKLPDSFTLRASKDGYIPVTKSWPPIPGRPPIGATGVDFWFELSSSGPFIDLTGTYEMTLTADSACTSLPAVARQRTYTAAIRLLNKPTDFLVTLSGASFYMPYDSFGGQTAGEFVRFDVYRWIEVVEPAIVEQLHDNAVVAIQGTAPTSVTVPISATITAALEGSFEYCSDRLTGPVYQCPSAERVTCASANHQLRLTRR